MESVRKQRRIAFDVNEAKMRIQNNGWRTQQRHGDTEGGEGETKTDYIDVEVFVPTNAVNLYF